jgi:hypothetical protein
MRGWMAALALSIVPGCLASCSGSGPGKGPLQALSAGGQPTVDGASLDVHPGKLADFTAFVFNPLTSSVTLLSASVVPIPGGKPTVRLVHTGIATTKGFAGADNGWPPPDVPIRPMAGGQIGHGQSDILFAIVGDTPGRAYSVAGLKIRYRYQGQTYDVFAPSAAVACVVKGSRNVDACPNAASSVQANVKKMIGETP